MDLQVYASDILIKQIKPNFKTLGPKFGKEMRLVASEVQKFTQEDINKIEKLGSIAIDVNGKNITLELSDVEISSKDIEGWFVANEGNLTVALEVTITDDLRKEGVARELINRIQNTRKDSGLEVTDKIELTVLRNQDFEASILDNKTYVMAETLTDNLVFVDELQQGTEIEFDHIKSKIQITKL